MNFVSLYLWHVTKERVNTLPTRKEACLPLPFERSGLTTRSTHPRRNVGGIALSSIKSAGDVASMAKGAPMYLTRKVVDTRLNQPQRTGQETDRRKAVVPRQKEQAQKNNSQSLQFCCGCFIFEVPKHKAMTTEDLYEILTNGECMLADGFEKALIGHTNGPVVKAVYDYELCVAILMHEGEMTCDEALEFMEFNVTGAYVGETTPVFITLKYGA